MNRYKINAPVAIASTDDNTFATGVTGARWVGMDPTVLGAAGNVGAGNGLTYSDAIVESAISTAIAKTVSITFPNLAINQTNYFQQTLDSMQFSSQVEFLGIVPIGIAGGVGAPLTVQSAVLGALNYSIVRDSLAIKIPQAQVPNVSGKTLNLIIYYK